MCVSLAAGAATHQFSTRVNGPASVCLDHDGITRTPVILAPSAGSQAQSSIKLQYRLLESCAWLRLRLESATQTSELTLASSIRTATGSSSSHELILNTAHLASSPLVSSVVGDALVPAGAATAQLVPG